MIFSQEHFEKILKLNEEFSRASRPRQQEIELEIIELAPKEIFPSSKELEEISKLQEELKGGLERLVVSGSRSDFESYVKELNSIDEKICSYAQKLGSNLDKTDYGKTMAYLLETKFGKS